MTVKDRLTEFVDWLNISKSEFCRQIDVSNAFISSIRKSIQQDKVQRIALKYPILNIEWLLTGKGEMLKKEEKPKDFTQSENEFLRYLMEENKKCHRVIEDQMELMKGMQHTIENLQNQLNNEKSEASVAPEAGAGCAVAG